MAYVISTRTGGYLANQLYYVLQAFCRGFRGGFECRYQVSPAYAGYCDISKFKEQLNISEYISENARVDEFLELNRYFQDIAFDFSKDELELFIKKTIAKSVKLGEVRARIAEEPGAVAVHIRNGDFLKIGMYNCFNKAKYLEEALSRFEGIKRLHVYSDDNGLNEKLYGAVFKKHAESVEYANGSTIEDFLELSSYRRKILWNSTYSYWTGFVSCVMNEKAEIVCPVLTFKNESARKHGLDRWEYI